MNQILKKHYGGLKLRKIKTHNNYQLNALMHVRINAFFNSFNFK